MPFPLFCQGLLEDIVEKYSRSVWVICLGSSAVYIDIINQTLQTNLPLFQPSCEPGLHMAEEHLHRKSNWAPGSQNS